MKWNRIDLFVSQEATELVALLLYEYGSNGTIIDEEKSHDEFTCITAYFSAKRGSMKESLQNKLMELSKNGILQGNWYVAEQELDDKTWLYTWQQYFHAKKISSHFWVTPAWEMVKPGAGEDVIRIDPGLAFGSGLHDTTCMCIEYLERTVKAGDMVIDIGTGTGILAICAAKLGASRVTAVDYDEKAVMQAGINVDLNQVADRICICNSDLLAAVSADAVKADVIVANIVSDAIISLMPLLSKYMHDTSTFIASGIIDERICDIYTAADKNGFTLTDTCLRNGWYSVCMRVRI